MRNALNVLIATFVMLAAPYVQAKPDDFKEYKVRSAAYLQCVSNEENNTPGFISTKSCYEDEITRLFTGVKRIVADVMTFTDDADTLNEFAIAIEDARRNMSVVCTEPENPGYIPALRYFTQICHIHQLIILNEKIDNLRKRKLGLK